MKIRVVRTGMIKSNGKIKYVYRVVEVEKGIELDKDIIDEEPNVGNVLKKYAEKIKSEIEKKIKALEESEFEGEV